MKKLFDMYLIQKNDIDMGVTCDGEALVSPTDEGAFSGDDGLSGKVLPIGMGVTYTPAPGRNDVVSSLLLETEDGARILMDMKAMLEIDPAVEEKLMEGEPVSPNEYYFKGIVTFRTGDEKYKWLERRVCVCENRITDWERVDTAVYMV